jgi:hypothetical protein
MNPTYGVNMPKTTFGIYNGPFRDYCERRVAEGESWGELASRVYGKRTETSSLQRLVGAIPYWSHGRKRKLARISYSSAVKLTVAFDLDPVDVGI